MSDLPIKVSSVSAKPAASKPAGNPVSTQQDAQEFGNVLARQVADSAKPSESATRSTGETPQQASEQDNAKSSRVEESASPLPADIMAVLLAQQSQVDTPQSQIVTAQPGMPSQATIQPQLDANLLPLVDVQTNTGASGKQSGTALAPLGGKAIPADATMPESNMALPKINNTNQNGKGLSDTVKAQATAEISLSSTNPSLRGANAISDMASTMQQPGAISLLVAGNTVPNSPVSISADVGQPAWGDEFSQKITWMATQRNQTAELHLNPPQLGPLDVTLKMNGDQASAIFTSPHAAVREAIEQAMPKLREMLADSGIMLGNAMVSDHAAKNGQDSSARNPAGRSPNSVSAGTSEDSAFQETRVSPIRRHNGMVDTFA